MPLMSCPECEKQVSDAALACPNCGFPVQKAVRAQAMAQQPPSAPASAPAPVKRKKTGWIIAGVVVGAFAIFASTRPSSQGGVPPELMRAGAMENPPARPGNILPGTIKRTGNWVTYSIRSDEGPVQVVATCDGKKRGEMRSGEKTMYDVALYDTYSGTKAGTEVDYVCSR